MQLLIYSLVFLGGIAVTVGALLLWAWTLRMKDRVAFAESAQKQMEEAILLAEQQRQLAEAELQNKVAELLRKRQAKSTEAVSQYDTAATVKDRLRKAGELTAKQSKIDVNRGPESVMQHNELELEKLTVLKSILADGFDPVITIRYNTGDQEMLLSNYVQSITKGLA